MQKMTLPCLQRHIHGNRMKYENVNVDIKVRQILFTRSLYKLHEVSAFVLLSAWCNVSKNITRISVKYSLHSKL
jgi:hypothetical protein